MIDATFGEPWALALLPLAALPFVRAGREVIGYSWLAMIPADRWSTLAGATYRLLAVATIVLVVLGLAALGRGEARVERLGQGAEIVLLLDRSRSMDQPFYTATRAEDLQPALAARSGESKTNLARRLLSDFIARRPDDLFGMVIFSTLPIEVLDFTQKHEVIQAAIAASAIGKGIGDTDLGLGLERALSLFEGRPYTGSRIILLVSDGGAHLDVATRERLARLVKQHRVSLYWIYIRSFRSPGLLADKDVDAQTADTVPEHFLHRYFSEIGTPYRAYEAENAQALQEAIDDVNRLERLPIQFTEVLPRRDLSQYCYAAALACAAALLAMKWLEVRRWA
ncbi:MAG TPA: vWA domain-containing protein [Burkholderiales bacterium]|nr:vWA domain-containing protein [Burkholderiales bacterium]